MHECKGTAVVRIEVEIPIVGAFNGNYRSGEEELEEVAQEHVLSYLPTDWKVSINDVTIKGYQLLDKEIEHED